MRSTSETKIFYVHLQLLTLIIKHVRGWQKKSRAVSLTVIYWIEVLCDTERENKRAEQQKHAGRQLKLPDYLMFASIDIKVNRFKVPRGFAWNSVPHDQVLVISGWSIRSTIVLFMATWFGRTTKERNNMWLLPWVTKKKPRWNADKIE